MVNIFSFFVSLLLLKLSLLQISKDYSITKLMVFSTVFWLKTSFNTN